MSIHHLNRRPARTIQEDLAALHRDLDEVAAGLHENHEALTALEKSVAELKADSTEILSLLRGAR